jgi:hypothetical protein
MDKRDAALGASGGEAVGTCLAVDPAKLNEEERIFLLEEQMKHMQRVILRLRKEQVKNATPTPALPPGNLNKDGIPIGTVCFGATEKSPFLNYLTVEENGYTVGSTLFPSLSAAAEAVSLVRRSGWTFWKMLDGRTLKEAFRE